MVPTPAVDEIILGLPRSEQIMVKKLRALMYCMYFHTIQDVRDEQLRPLLFGLVDDGFKKK